MLRSQCPQHLVKASQGHDLGKETEERGWHAETHHADVVKLQSRIRKLQWFIEGCEADDDDDRHRSAKRQTELDKCPKELRGLRQARKQAAEKPQTLADISKLQRKAEQEVLHAATAGQNARDKYNKWKTETQELAAEFQRLHELSKEKALAADEWAAKAFAKKAEDNRKADAESAHISRQLQRDPLTDDKRAQCIT